MARTKPELKQIIKRRLFRSNLNSFTFDELIIVLGDMSVVKKEGLVTAIVEKDRIVVLNILNQAIRTEADRLADIEADAMLEDDNLSLDEIDKIL